MNNKKEEIGDIQILPGDYINRNGIEEDEMKLFSIDYFKNSISNISYKDVKEIEISSYYVFYGIDDSFSTNSSLHIYKDKMKVERFREFEFETIIESNRSDLCDDYDKKLESIIDKLNSIYKNFDSLEKNEYGDSTISIEFNDETLMSIPNCLSYIIDDLFSIIPDKIEYIELIKRFARIITTKEIENNFPSFDENQYEIAIRYKGRKYKKEKRNN